MLALNGHKIVRSKTPHEYQEDALTKLYESWEEFNRSLVCIATGGGKGYLSAEVAAREIEKGGRVLFLAHRRNLCDQFKLGFERDFGCAATMEMGPQKADDSPMVVASVQTMCNRIRQGRWNPDDFEIVLVDEAHRMLSDGHMEAVSFFKKAKVAGWTATPRRSDKRDLLSFFENMPVDISIKELIEKKFLAPIVIQNVPIQIELKAESKTSDYTDLEVSSAIEPYLERCADAYAEHGRNRAGIVFLPLIVTSKKFCAMLNERGIKCAHVDGEMPDREQQAIKRRLEMGELQCVTNSQVWGEGTDIRCISLVCVLRPTRSWSFWVQMDGRGTRTYDPKEKYAPRNSTWPLKENLMLLDLCWLTDELNLLQRPSTILASTPEEAEALDRQIKKGGSGPVDLMEANNNAIHDREEALRLKLEATAKRKARFVSADEFLLMTHHPDLADYEPLNANEARPLKGSLSDKQMQWLSKSRFDLESIKNYGHAKHVLNALGERAKAGLATMAQVSYASSLGLDKDTAFNMAFHDISKWIDDHAPKKPWMKNWKNKH